ncbi:cytochrome c [Vibrio sp. ZSDE26]|uniref:Cytochrome c n=1 Tax=Vibrio amylolyticus TaxID=2847292 RepID=A0A9X1XT22_9VIBR|nr:cytochrome c [Vibrio amylolyticus]MCK6265059.1 cytochrome c [Vibrio amylolyticus]
MRRIALVMFTALISGCDRDIHDHPHLVTGQQLFEHHCSSCHQSTGQGRFLKGIPANRSTGLTKEQIIDKMVSPKEAGDKMPNFPNMDNEESGKIADYVKSL